VRVAAIVWTTTSWLFSHITMNWRGRPLTSHEVVVQTIAATRTSRGLHVEAVLDPGDYPTGIAISKERFAALPLERHAVHGAWNYTLRPAADIPAVSEGTTSQHSSTARRRLEMLARLNDERLTGMTSAALARLCAALLAVTLLDAGCPLFRQPAPSSVTASSAAAGPGEPPGTSAPGRCSTTRHGCCSLSSTSGRSAP
jgi:hypothetical protein